MNLGVLDTRDGPHRPTSGRAGLDVDGEHALQALRPAHRGATFGRCRLVCVLTGVMPTAPAPAWPVSPARGIYCSAQTLHGSG
jgi:hypothetical protein